ncbi:MAG: peptidoglycan DD-metalloendopeptidase family protein, partial [Oscillospiraceae bacterium]|nr:peptidoglycan DD-metalloendopeptidase family protein [Oscillospiraceae bacterium]
MRSKYFDRAVCLLLSLTMAMCLWLTPACRDMTALAAPVSQSALNDLKQQRTSIQQKIQDIEAEINSLEYEKKSTLAKKEVLDEQIRLTQEEINNLTEQIAVCEEEIAIKEAEVVAAQAAMEEQWEQYQVRIRAMEENGTVSYYSIIFGATSFSDLLVRLDIIDEVMKSDEAMYQQLVAAKKAIEDAKAALEDAKVQLQEAKAEQETVEAELERQVEEANQLLISIEANLDEYNKLQEEAEASKAQIQKEIDEMVEALERQEAAAKAAASAGGGSTTSVITTGTGRFIWPSYTTRVTSNYGMRTNPVSGIYRLHAGVDIGASYGTDIYAADSGTVVTSKYGGGYGNYVVIYHGNGYSTLYGHMSAILCHSGQYVTQDSRIGKVGSTGLSTGPHLHFTVFKNGKQ